MAQRRAPVTKQIETSKKRSAQDVASPPPKRVKAPAAMAAKSPPKKGSRDSKAPTQKPFLNTAPTARIEVFVFGDGSSGELGLGNKYAVEVKSPRLNHNLDPKSVGVVSLAAGGMHTVALTYDNKVLTWGVNDLSALGRDTIWEGKMRDINEENDSDSDASDYDLNPRESNPTAIPADKFPAGTKFVQAAAGDSASFVLTSEGLVYGWGTFRDSKGVFGFYLKPNKEVIKVQHEPMLIPGLKRIVQLRVGNDFCLALDAEGNVFSWGSGEQCQLGRRLIDRRRVIGLVPTRVSLPKKIVSIHTGADHAFAIDSDGNTWAWGSNNFGQTGIAIGAGQGGSIVIVPQKIPSLIGKNMKMIQGGIHHSIGVTRHGECFVWGRVDGAQMGLDINKLSLDDPSKFIIENGRPRILLQPTSLSISGCIYAAAGSDHNIVITSDGKAYSWGFNANYQCGQGSIDDDISIATLIKCTRINGKKLSWAGAGGQYSMLASRLPKGSVRVGFEVDLLRPVRVGVIRVKGLGEPFSFGLE